MRSDRGYDKRIRIRDQVTDIIRQAIIAGRFAPGQRLSERALSRELKVSTTPIKEALRRLEVEGLVESLARSGTIVSELCKLNLEEIALIRSAMEGVAASLAARKISDQEIDGLQDMLARMQTFTEKGDTNRLVEVNTEFHRTIRCISGNPYLIQIIDSLNEFDLGMRHAALSNEHERHIGLDEHMSILRAVASRNSDEAERLVRMHVKRSADAVLQGAEAERRV